MDDELFVLQNLYYIKFNIIQNLMRNGAQKMQKETQMFLPIENYIIIWYLLVMVAVIIDIFITIYHILFQKYQAQGDLILLKVSIIAIILGADIIISLNTGFFYKGTMITQKKAARLRYVKSYYFFFDVISLSGIVSEYFLFQIFPFVKLVIFLKLVKLGKYNEIIRKYVIKNQYLKLFYELFKHFILLIMTCHTIGCMFFNLDLQLIQLGWYPNEQLWVYNSYAYLDIITLQYYYQYFYCFYFAAATLSGVAYGDIAPLNPIQTTFTMFTLLIPLIIYSYVLSVLLNAIIDRRNKSLSLQKYKKITIQYLRDSGLEENQIPKFTNFLSYAYTNKINSADNNFLQQMDPTIKKQYIENIFSQNFNYELFKPLCNSSVKFQVLEQIIGSIGEEVSLFAKKRFNVQKPTKIKLYYILSGEVSEYIYLKDKKLSKLHGAGSFYLQYPFYTGLLNFHDNYLFQTTKFTICLAVDLDKFNQKLRRYESVLQSYHMVRKQIIFAQHLSPIQVKCFFCESNGHIIDNCPRLTVVKDKYATIEQKYNISHHKRNNQYKRMNLKQKKQKSQLKSITQQCQEKREKQTQTLDGQNEKIQVVFDCIHADRARNWKNYDNQYNI